MNVVITGATSMIGSAIANEFCKDSSVDKVFAIVRKNTTKTSRLPSSQKIKIIECDADEYNKLPSLIHTQCDVFYHVAWSATGEKRNEIVKEQIKNISYSLDALYAAKELKCRMFIGSGSQAEYGPLNIPSISPDSPTKPVQPYGIAKYAAGRILLEISKSIDICCVWVRVFSVYGEFDKATTMISSTILKMMKNEHISMTKGEQMWDYLYSSDAGRAFYLIGKSNIKSNKIYCLGSGHARRLIDYIMAIKSITGSSSTLGIGELNYKNNITFLCANVSELKKDIEWEPKVSFEDGIKRIYEYYQSSK